MIAKCLRVLYCVAGRMICSSADIGLSVAILDTLGPCAAKGTVESVERVQSGMSWL